MYVEINKSIYWPKQNVIIVHLQYFKHMDGHGYHPIPCNTDLWAHHILPTKFWLCVGDFRVKYFSEYQADYLLNALKNHYAVSTDWEVKIILVWELSGTIKTDTLIFLFQIIFQNPSTVCNIQNQRNPNMHRTSVLHQIIVSSSKWIHIRIQVLLWARRR